MPAWTPNPFWQQGNTYGGVDLSGNPMDWYNTPLSELDYNLPRGEFERYLTNNGFGGFGRRDEWGRAMYNRANSGFESAQLSNPDLNFRDYLNTYLSPNALDEAYMSLSGQARGDSTPGQTRRIMWG